MWYKNNLNKPYIDLIRYLDIIKDYFYIYIFICKIYLKLLVVYCPLKTNHLKYLYNCFCTI